jgi:isocitrate dehydrogenase (NAD+)
MDQDVDGMANAAQIPATLIPGDGIGPEIAAAVVRALEALGSPFVWQVGPAGQSAVDQYGTLLPDDTLASIRRTGLALKGPLTTPVGGGFRSINVTLRETFDLFANVRPARTIVAGRYKDIDLVLVRENLEGLYVGQEQYIRVGDDPQGAGMAIGINTRAGSSRIAEFAFDYAARHGRRKVTAVHKANILKVLSGLFLDATREVAQRYSDRIRFEERIVDACAMQLVLDSSKFDVLVTTNLFGDILSDLIAGLIGGLGMAPGANIGPNVAIFEAVHGSAPDIAGHGVANPVALMLAAGLMLEHVGLADSARQLRNSIDRTLAAGIRTPDLGGTATTAQFGEAVAGNI